MLAPSPRRCALETVIVPEITFALATNDDFTPTTDLPSYSNAALLCIGPMRMSLLRTKMMCET